MSWKLLIVMIAVLLVAIGLWRFVRLGRASAEREVGALSLELEPCPRTPNCVSSLAERESQRVEPLAMEGAPEDSLEKVRQAIESMPGGRVVAQGDWALRAEFTSRIFGFVDDLTVVADESAGVLQVRSASRVGHGDLGTNRRRVEALRRRLT